MTVSIDGKPASKRQRLGRGKGFDREIRAFASLIIEEQTQGRVSSQDIAIALNEAEVRRASGRAWSSSSVHRMLRRGKEMGIPFRIRSYSEAASARKITRRSDGVIRAERFRLAVERANGKIGK